jgi:hypothetical protein
MMRRRRTRRHRRNRRVRSVLLAVFCAGLVIGFAFVVPQLLSRFRGSRSVGPDRQAVEASRNIVLLTQQESLRQLENRPVYRYSVVPGGVTDARELKWAADHDPVVASHYAGSITTTPALCVWSWRAPFTFPIESGIRSIGLGTESRSRRARPSSPMAR